MSPFDPTMKRSLPQHVRHLIQPTVLATAIRRGTRASGRARVGTRPADQRGAGLSEGTSQPHSMRSRVEGGKTNQQTLAEALVNDALAGNPVALKIVAPIALALDNEGKDREEEVTALQQKLIDDFNHREASTDSMEHAK